MKNKWITVPNCITMFRIVGSVGLLFVAPFTKLFYILYSLCGISDAVDGAIARITRSTTELGAKLDSIADMLFYAVVLLKIFPALWDTLPIFIWYGAISAILIRIASYVTAAVKYKRFASIHTYMNKLTSFTIFTVSYFVGTDTALIYVCIAVAVFSNLAAIEEFFIHLTTGKYDPERKTLLNIKDDKFKKFVR